MNASQAIRVQAGNSIRRISRPVLWLGNLHRPGRYLTLPGRGLSGVTMRDRSSLAKLKARRRWVMSRPTCVSAVSGSLWSPR
jgi:hypothetical protein